MKLTLALLLALSCCAPALAEDHQYTPHGNHASHGSTPLFFDEGVTQYTAQPVDDVANPTNAPFFIRLDPAEGHPVDVIFQNRLVSPAFVPREFTFIYHGITLHVLIDSGDGSLPDTMIVTPPPGFYTIPESVTVEENMQGRIEVHPYAMF